MTVRKNSGRHADQNSESVGERFFRYRSRYGDEYPPHNLYRSDNRLPRRISTTEDISIEGLMEHIPPDFPTAAIINGRRGIEVVLPTVPVVAVYIRARAEAEADENGRETIIVHEISHQVNKAPDRENRRAGER